MSLGSIPDELKDLRKLEKVLISTRIIMHRKGEFAIIKGRICNILIEAANICIILPRHVDSNGLIVMKIKLDCKYRGHVYFKLVHPSPIYQALNYLKTHNKFYEDISISECL